MTDAPVITRSHHQSLTCITARCSFHIKFPAKPDLLSPKYADVAGIHMLYPVKESFVLCNRWFKRSLAASVRCCVAIPNAHIQMPQNTCISSGITAWTTSLLQSAANRILCAFCTPESLAARRRRWPPGTGRETAGAASEMTLRAAYLPCIRASSKKLGVINNGR